MNKTISGYKGFDKNFQCRGFQFKPETTYTHDGEVKICEKGFHFCENPLDIFNYYAPTDNRFAQVEGEGNLVKQENTDSKTACNKLHVKLEVNLLHLISRGVKFILDKIDWKTAAATNTGNSSAATNTGYRSAATNTGNSSAATNTGYSSAATNTGNSSAATNTGYRSAATNTGYSSATTNTGYSSAASVEGKESIAIVTGYQSKAKGKLGCWLVLTERDDNFLILGVQAVKVDGLRIKEDIFYQLQKGEIIAIE